MVRFADLVSKITIEKTTTKAKVFKNPEWWSTQHKLKKEVKNAEMIKEAAKSAGFNSSYKVITLENQPPVDQFIREMRTKLDWQQYNTYAPWNPIFNKSDTIIVFSNKPKTL